MAFIVERADGRLETVDAEFVGKDDTTLFFWTGGAKTIDNVVKTFNNSGGWLSVWTKPD